MKFNIVLKDVSILARPEGRALHNIQHIPPVEGAFQSSPAPKGGRYFKVSGSGTEFALVSILARPEGRALLARQ